MRACRGRVLAIFGALTITGVVGTIVVNAVWMQVGPHPAPLMARKAPGEAAKTPVETTGAVAATPPRARPVEAAATPAGEPPAALPRPRPQNIEELQRDIASAERKTPAPVGPPRPRKVDGGANPTSPPPARVTAVQRALAEYGFGQIKPSGVIDEATRKAVEKFERERNLPVTGQVSPRLLRELAAVTGRPIN